MLMTWTKEMPANPVVAIAGATGAVGAEFLQVLHDVDFPASEVRALASARSAGKTLPLRQQMPVHYASTNSIP